MKLFCFLLAALAPILPIAWAQSTTPQPSTTIQDGIVTIIPAGFDGAINNPLKGFRDYKENGYGLIVRQYIEWNKIEMGAGDSVDRIIAHTNKITKENGKNFEDLNIKLVPRVYLDWDGTKGAQHWPADMHTFDYDSPEFHDRLRKLIAKLGQAWDNDPRIFAVQMGLIGTWGEHHSPTPTPTQIKLLAEEFKKAFKNKPILVRHNDKEFMDAGFGLYYDTYGYIGREPPNGPKDQFPMQATHVHQDAWKAAPMEGEVEYNWQKSRSTALPEKTFGKTEDETMLVPAYRNYMIDKIRRYHTTYLGWISNYDHKKPDVLAGAGELQKAFGYNFVIDSVSYPLSLKRGAKLPIKLKVTNTGSAPFYANWPVGVALLDPATTEPVWMAPINDIDIRKWMPGEKWNSEKFAYDIPAISNESQGSAQLPRDMKPGSYILALTILDREGGMMPSVRFSNKNYFQGGWHPMGIIGIDQAPTNASLQMAQFDNPAFDTLIRYKVPESIRNIKEPAKPKAKAVTRWEYDPKSQLIDPWRYWSLDDKDHNLEKQILWQGKRTIRVTGNFKEGGSLAYSMGKVHKLEKGKYRFNFKASGNLNKPITFELGDDWRKVTTVQSFSVTNSIKEFQFDFEVNRAFEDSSVLRLQFPKVEKGIFDLTEPRLIKINQ